MPIQYHSMPEERGQRIREMRKKKGLTGKQLAKLLDVNTGTISRYEKGITKHIKEPILEAIARYLDTDIHYLNTGKPTKNPAIQITSHNFDTLESPIPAYQRIFKQSQVQEILSELDKIQKNQSDFQQNADHSFVMIAEEDSSDLRILRQDYLFIEPCKHLVPERVNLVLENNKIRFFRALKMENATLLQISDREAVSDANLGRYNLKLIGVCLKLERKNV